MQLCLNSCEFLWKGSCYGNTRFLMSQMHVSSILFQEASAWLSWVQRIFGKLEAWTIYYRYYTTSATLRKNRQDPHKNSGGYAMNVVVSAGNQESCSILRPCLSCLSFRLMYGSSMGLGCTSDLTICLTSFGGLGTMTLISCCTSFGGLGTATCNDVANQHSDIIRVHQSKCTRWQAKTELETW